MSGDARNVAEKFIHSHIVGIGKETFPYMKIKLGIIFA